jgi:hypothetical protein
MYLTRKYKGRLCHNCPRTSKYDIVKLTKIGIYVLNRLGIIYYEGRGIFKEYISS